jgi:hypothetical protein
MILFAIGCFEHGLAHIEVRALHDTVGARVVTADPNMLDVVLALQMTEGRDEGLAIVRDDLSQGAPSAQYVLEDPVAERLRSFLPKHPKLGVASQRTSALYYI